MTSSPTASASKTSSSVTSSARVKKRSIAPSPASAGWSGRATTARNGVPPSSRSAKTGHRRTRSSSTAKTGWRVSWAVMQGPSPVVNCSRSAAAASSELAPSGTRRPAESIRLMPAPSTFSIRAAAAASRTGSSSGPPRPGSSAATSASWKRPAMVTGKPCPRRGLSNRAGGPERGRFGRTVGAATMGGCRRAGRRACCPTATARCSSRCPISPRSRPCGRPWRARRCRGSRTSSRRPGRSSSSSTGRRRRPMPPPSGGSRSNRPPDRPAGGRSTSRSCSTAPTSPRSRSSPAGRCRHWWRRSRRRSSRSRSAVSPRASPTSPGCRRSCTSRGGRPRGPASRRVRSAWPGRSPAPIRGPRPVAGSWSAAPTPSLFDVDRDPPALLGPGVRVRFRQVG